MRLISAEEYKSTLTPVQLETAVIISDMIADIIPNEGMTANTLVACLMSEPYNLSPTEENLDMILNLLNLKDTVYRLKLIKGRENLSLEPVIYA